MLTNTNGEGSYQIVLRRPGVLPPDGGETIEVKEQNIGPTIRKLRQLAPLGWSLYTQLPAQAPLMFNQLFDNPEDFVVHVTRPTTSSFVLPWGLIY